MRTLLSLAVAATVATLILLATGPVALSARADGPAAAVSAPARPALEEADPFGDVPKPAEQPAAKEPAKTKPVEKRILTAKKPAANEPAKPAPKVGTLSITRGKPALDAKPTRQEGMSPQEERMEQVLDQPVTIEAVEAPVDEIVAGLRKELGVNLVLDQKALNDTGVSADTPVTVKLSDVSARTVLAEALRPLNLTCVYRDETLSVTTTEEADALLVTRVYSVAGLFLQAPTYPAMRSNDLGDTDGLFAETVANPWNGYLYGPNFGSGSGMGMGGMGGGGGGGGGGGMFNVLGQSGTGASAGKGSNQGLAGVAGPPTISPVLDDLINTITTVIDPTRWDSVGGPCSIAPLGDQLVVNANAPLHRKIDAFLKSLRAQNAARRVIRLEAHWIWLTESGLTSLLNRPEGAAGEAGDVVSEAAWKAFLKTQKERPDDAPQTCQALLKCFDGQTVSGVSGRQTRVVISMIPVVGQGPVYTPEPREVGYQPVTRTIQEGAALQVRPIASDDGKDVLLDLRTRYVEREDADEPAPEAPAAANAPAGAGGAHQALTVRAVVAAVDRPRVTHYRLETTLRVPAGQHVLVGGLTSGPPAGEETNVYLFVKASVEEPRRAGK